MDLDDSFEGLRNKLIIELFYSTGIYSIPEPGSESEILFNVKTDFPVDNTVKINLKLNEKKKFKLLLYVPDAVAGVVYKLRQS